MKVKLLIGLVALFALVFASCNDNIGSIGGNIQPGGDSISVAADTFQISAQTISMKDSMYARTIYGLLGKYQDDIFGTVQSDYMCELYCPSSGMAFDSAFSQIDSTQLRVSFYSFVGDSVAPMGLTAYELNKPLTQSYYTNVDPAPYYNTSDLLTQTSYTINGVPAAGDGSGLKTIIGDLGIAFGRNFYNAYKQGAFKNMDTFRSFFPGMYITTNFGSGNLIKVSNTSVAIYYTCRTTVTDVNTKLRKDTTFSKVLGISVTPEVIQLNRVQNDIPANLLQPGTGPNGTGMTYIKSPAGVCTEVTLPITEILAKAGDSTINLVRFKLSGFTEREPSSYTDFPRPRALLLINKDSVGSFFAKRQIADGETSYLSIRNYPNGINGGYDGGTNTYSFGNMSRLITSYKNVKTDPVFVILPVDVESVGYTTQQRTIYTITGIYNSMQPTNAILRSSDSDMQLQLVYQKINK